MPDLEKPVKEVERTLDRSAIFTAIGIIILFSSAIAVTLIAPSFVDPSWTSPTNPYQVQMYEVADPNYYISAGSKSERQTVYHLKANYTLLAFQETESFRILAPKELEQYVTKLNDEKLKLTSRLLLLRPPTNAEESKSLKEQLVKEWKSTHGGEQEPFFQILELFVPDNNEAFSISNDDTIIENWVDKNYTILDAEPMQEFHKDAGVIYVRNPQEYRISFFQFASEKGWRYDPDGQTIASLEELKNPPLSFVSRQELIQTGEHIVAIEGCWYCHTDQTRTLIQDVVLNGSESYPAPPSTANEYIYDNITFPGTRRIGPDLSRVGIKRPNRDWHKAHFWSPKTASIGSNMPSFRHFFDADPRGTSKQMSPIPNFQFEAVYQYLMTKGTRITPPSEAWWLGKDPIKTKEIIEGKRKLP